MCKLKVADFYYGAFLSALLNTPGGRPSLFDKTDSRRIYRLETNNNEECFFYTKYVTDLKNKTDSFSHWVFNFSPAEVSKLQELHQQKRNVKVVLICAKEGFADSELAIVPYEDAIDCLGVNRGVKAFRINIKAFNNKHGLRMYGSGRSDKLNGKDNMIKITRKEIAAL